LATDDELPLLACALVHAHPNHLDANLEYMLHFRPRVELPALDALLASFQGALSIIHDARRSSVAAPTQHTTNLAPVMARMNLATTGPARRPSRVGAKEATRRQPNDDSSVLALDPSLLFPQLHETKSQRSTPPTVLRLDTDSRAPREEAALGEFLSQLRQMGDVQGSVRKDP